jgi:hypothetical protein
VPPQLPPKPRPTLHLRPALVAAAAFALVVSCTGPSPQPPGAQSSPQVTGGRQALPDPCRLLTQAEIGGAVGMTFGPAEPDPGSHRCNWRSTTPRPDTGLPTVVTVELYEDRPDEMTSMFNPTATSGVGDEAYFCGACPSDRTLFVRKHSAYFSVDEYPCYPAGPCGIAMSDERALALKVLPRL